jgi:cyclomaltodextrinase / maltogenic alpha-amylase / neopullulanase
VLKLGRYRHFKGHHYEVLGVAKNSETEDEFVVYRALYGEHGLWIRPLKMFTEEVERDGCKQPRFQFIGDSGL